MESFKFEAEKVSMKQLTSGDWQIVLKVDPTELDQSIMLMAPGERMMIASVSVDQNDRPVKAENVVKQNGRRTFDELPVVTQAVMACQRKDFQQWLDVENEEQAKQAILYCSAMTSRSEFKDQPEQWLNIWAKFKQDFGRE